MLGRGIILNPGLSAVLRGEADCRDEKAPTEGNFGNSTGAWWTATAPWTSATGMSCSR